MSTTRDLAREIEAARVLREQLAALNDEDLTRDMIEGETSLNEMIASMIRQDGEDEAHVTALKAYADDMDKRKKRIEARIETRRGLLAVAMEMAGKPKAETAFGTITLGVTAPKVIVTEESEIPSGFWVTPPPQLDKKTLLAALKALRAARDEAVKIEDAYEREKALQAIKPIPGAELSNGGARVTIRRA
jgi:hypothetical protein